MSVNNKENSLNSNDANKILNNESSSHSNNINQIQNKLNSENFELNDDKERIRKIPTTTTAIPQQINTIMPGVARNTMSGTVTELNSNTPLQSSDQCSDSEEDFDRTTRNLGADKWIFNYKDVSFVVFSSFFVRFVTNQLN